MPKKQTAKEAGRSDTSRRLSYIVFVGADSEVEELRKIQDAQQRSVKLRELFFHVKEPFLKSVERHRKDGLIIVDRLDGTQQFIVSAPKRSWDKFLVREGHLFSAPNVKLIPNSHEWQLV